jgi:hypothetical protein
MDKWDRRESFYLNLNIKHQQVNVDGVLELEKNHHFVAFMVKISSSKSHQEVLNLEGHFDEKQDVYINLKCLHTDCILDVRWGNLVII